MTDAASPLVLRALAEIRELKARLAAQTQGRQEPIAIIGMSCRFPGAQDVAGFHGLLREGRDAIGAPRIPGDRVGGYLANVDSFDHAFFGISGREAEAVDPQQRLLLEVAWEALEDAGLDVPALAASPTAVFIGSCTNDYARLQLSGARGLDAHMGTGGAASVQAGRIAYALGLQGPALVVDTACSSSLVAVHLACASLRAKEAGLAVVGGVNLILSPEATQIFDLANMLAPDGRCKTFDAAADGYVRGEGCGVLVLKPLAAAQRDGDRVLAVIRGSAVNQDGRSTGLTAPNVLSQEALLRQALKNAGCEPADLGMVEAHGTGTPLGDPIEVEALTRVLGAARQPCYLGSVKTNVGHLEGAAGMAGLFKAVLAVRHGEVFPHLHLNQLNPHITLEGTPFVVPAALAPWGGDRPRLAGVSSFGFSGTNAHVVLEQPPAAPRPEAAPAPGLLVLAARNEVALRQLAADHAAALAALPAAEFTDWCRVAARRSGQPQRLAVQADGPQPAAEALAAYVRGEAGPGLVAGRAPARAPGVAFVFAGQGTQYPRMAADLLDDPTFRAALDEVDALLAPDLGFSVREALLEDAGSRLHLTEVAQPAIFAVQVALTALWRERGIEPAAVVGHSIGEVAAAYVAGVLTLPQACTVVAARARAMAMPAAPGRMLVASCSREQLAGLLAPYGSRAGIAAENAGMAVTVAGEAAAIEAVAADLERAGIRARDLGVGYAFHSALMEPASRQLEAALAGLKPGRPQRPWYSTLTGARNEDAGAAYWARQVREPVAFRGAVAAAIAAGHRTFLEIGSDDVLAGPLRACGRDAGHPVVVAPSLRRGEAARATLLAAAGALAVAGQDLAWDQVLGRPNPGRQASLPAYPWQRERAWFQPATAGRRAATKPGGHPWLGEPLALATPAGATLHQGRLGTDASPFLADHGFQGTAVFPAMGHVDLMLAAAGPEPCELADLALEALWALPPGQDVELQLHATPQGDHDRRVEVHGRQGTAWTRFATAQLVPARGARAAGEPLEQIRARCAMPVEPAGLYSALAEQGLAYGPAFQGVVAAWRGANEALAQVKLPAAAGGAPHVLHPALLDAGLQAVLATRGGHEAGPFLPVGVARVVRHRAPGSEVWSHVTNVVERGPDLTADVVLRDAAGQALVELQGVHVRRLAGAASPLDAAVYKPTWEPQPGAAPTLGKARWRLVGDGTGLLGRLAELLRQAGDHVDLGSWDATPCDGVVALPGPGLDGVLEALALVQAQAAAGSTARCYWLMPGAGTDHAPLRGFVRAIATEHRELQPTSIELSAEPDDAELAALVRELHAPGREDALALRGPDRFVARLIPQVPAAASLHAPIRAGATYLVTGGLGSLGLELAGWLASAGAGHLVLLGRRGPTAEAEAVLERLRTEGCHVVVAAADVADEQALTQVFRDVLADMPPLAGVFHAAGVLDDALAVNLTPDHVRRVFAPKVAGARHLHALTRRLPLDHFVLFSSAAAVLGSPGQANYAAANAYLDALARERRAQGLAGLSIGWGPWARIGMAARTSERTGRGVLAGIEPAEGLAVLGKLLQGAEAHVAVLPFDRERLQPALQEAPLQAHLALPATASRPAGRFAAALREVPYEQRLPLIVGKLRELLAAVLGTDAGRLPTDRPLLALGLDSLLGLDLKGQIDRETGLDLPVVALLKGPTIDELALDLLDRLTDPADALAELDDLSEEAADALLQRLLAEETQP